MSTAGNTTYHVLRGDDREPVLALLRVRRTGEGAVFERFRPGEGWVESPSAADLMRNGQDYDLIDAREAARLAAQLVDEGCA